MRIGELAEQADISTKAIRYYEQIGILAPPARTASGYRAYDQAALGRLGFVCAAQAVGLTLGEIRQIIAFRDNGQAPCAHVSDVLQRHAADLDGAYWSSSSSAASSGSWPSGPPPLTPSTARPSRSATSSPDTMDEGVMVPGSVGGGAAWRPDEGEGGRSLSGHRSPGLVATSRWMMPTRDRSSRSMMNPAARSSGSGWRVWWSPAIGSNHRSVQRCMVRATR